MRRRLGRLSIMGLACVFAITQAHADPITLRLADGLPSGHIIDRTIIEPFIKQATEAADGRLIIQHFPAEQLGKSRDMLMLTQAHVADISFIVPSYQSDRMPLATVSELPGIFQSTCQGNAALRALTDDGGILWEKEFKPNGIKPLIIFLLPPYQLLLSSSRPLTTLKDAEGLKIRTPGGAMDLTAMSLGAVPIKIGPSEIYESMSRGTLDGAMLAYQSAMAYHLGPLLKSGTLGLDFGTVTVTFSVNLDTWNALPPDIQGVLAKTGRALSLQACEKMDKAEADALAKARDGNIRMIDAQNSDHAGLEAAFLSVREEWVKRLEARGRPGRSVLSAFQEAAEAAKTQ